VSLEGLDRSVLTQLTHMDTHVCAAGGKRVVALPVHVQSRCCWEAETELSAAAAVTYVETEHGEKRWHEYHALTRVFVRSQWIGSFTLQN